MPPRSVWAARFRDALKSSVGPPTHRWWPPLAEAWTKTAEASIEAARALARAIMLMAEEIGDDEMRAIAHTFWTQGGNHPRYTIEMRDALAMRALASRRRRRE